MIHRRKGVPTARKPTRMTTHPLRAMSARTRAPIVARRPGAPSLEPVNAIGAYRGRQTRRGWHAPARAGPCRSRRCQAMQTRIAGTAYRRGARRHASRARSKHPSHSACAKKPLRKKTKKSSAECRAFGTLDLQSRACAVSPQHSYSLQQRHCDEPDPLPQLHTSHAGTDTHTSRVATSGARL